MNMKIGLTGTPSIARQILSEVHNPVYDDGKPIVINTEESTGKTVFGLPLYNILPVDNNIYELLTTYYLDELTRAQLIEEITGSEPNNIMDDMGVDKGEEGLTEKELRDYISQNHNKKFAIFPNPTKTTLEESDYKTVVMDTTQWFKGLARQSGKSIDMSMFLYQYEKWKKPAQLPLTREERRKEERVKMKGEKRVKKQQFKQRSQ